MILDYPRGQLMSDENLQEEMLEHYRAANKRRRTTRIVLLVLVGIAVLASAGYFAKFALSGQIMSELDVMFVCTDYQRIAMDTSLNCGEWKDQVVAAAPPYIETCARESHYWTPGRDRDHYKYCLVDNGILELLP